MLLEKVDYTVHILDFILELSVEVIDGGRVCRHNLKAYSVTFAV